jgi:UDP-glucose 4-epimerase
MMSEVQELSKAQPARSVLVTGAGGYLGHLVIRALAEERGELETLVALDLAEPAAAERLSGVTYVGMDIRAGELKDLVVAHRVDTVVHLASVVATRNGAMTRELQYDVDVCGTENVLEACLAGGVRKLIVTSSGAAYGYHADNSAWLTEDAPLRGNDVFPYARHKRLVEEMLARYRQAHPALTQLVLRPGTILGESARGPIADFFEKPVILGLKGAATPFVFIWDRDVVACVLEGVRTDKSGIYNLAGDGVMTLREIAAAMGKPFVALPEGLLEKALALLKRYGLTQYGPEQLLFLAHRPVLSNERLKREFGYRPAKTSREVFELYRQSRSGSPLGGTGALSAGSLWRALLDKAVAKAAD